MGGDTKAMVNVAGTDVTKMISSSEWSPRNHCHKMRVIGQKKMHFDTGNKTSFLKYFILEQEERTQIYTKAETNDDF